MGRGIPPIDRSLNWKGLWFKLNLFNWVRATSLFEASEAGLLVTLLCEAARSVPAGYLPDDEQLLKELSGFNNFSGQADWKRVRNRFKASLQYPGYIYCPQLLDPKSIHNPPSKRADAMAQSKSLGTHTKMEWELLKELCGFACVACGDAKSSLTKDHVLPVSRNGSDSIENIQPLCLSCNCKKGVKFIEYISSEVRRKFDSSNR